MNTRGPLHGEPSFPDSQATPEDDAQFDVGSLDAERNQCFEKEFNRFLLDRRVIRRYMPTPDFFPLVCELIDETKKYYVRLPRIQRNNLRHIPFFYFGREWVIRINFGAVALTNGVYIDLCDTKKAALVTVAVSFANDILAAESNA